MNFFWKVTVLLGYLIYALRQFSKRTNHWPLGTIFLVNLCVKCFSGYFLFKDFQAVNNKQYVSQSKLNLIDAKAIFFQKYAKYIQGDRRL